MNGESAHGSCLAATAAMSAFHPEPTSAMFASGSLFQCPVSGRMQMTAPDPKRTLGHGGAAYEVSRNGEPSGM